MSDERRFSCSKADKETIERALAFSARLLATVQKHVGPILHPGLAKSADTSLDTIGAALCILDPDRAAKDFAEEIDSIVDREMRKASILATIKSPGEGPLNGGHLAG